MRRHGLDGLTPTRTSPPRHGAVRGIRPGVAALPSRGTLALLALLYALAMFYASTAISPNGFLFKPGDPWAALDRLIYVATHGWEQHGSDQRADWTANLLIMVPMGALVAGSLRARSWFLKLLGMLIALAICLAWVLAVKYVQIFFPRTVTLNYIVAQSIGAVIGVLMAVLGERPIGALLVALRRQDRVALRALCLMAAFASIAFMLAPYDLALSAQDISDRLESLSLSMLVLPFGDRPIWMRPILWAAGGVAVVPVGMALWFSCADAPESRRRGMLIRRIVATVLLTWIASLFVLSASPSIYTLPSRLIGMGAGAAMLEAVTTLHLVRARLWLQRVTPWTVLPYLLAVVAFSGLFGQGWFGLEEAWERLDKRLLLPLWSHYMVSKAWAAKSTAVHLALYAPIGAMLWAGANPRRPIGGGRIFLAVVLAGGLALAVEVARTMKPGMQPDFNDIGIAALAAWGTLVLLPRFWTMLEDLAASRTGRR